MESLREPLVVQVTHRKGTIGKANTVKALNAAKLLKSSAARTLPEAVELANTRESFHRDVEAKLRGGSGKVAV